MASVIVPKIQEPIAGPGGITSMAWYTYFQNLRIAASGNAELQAAIDEILKRLAALENDSPVDFQLLGPASVRVRGNVADGMVQLTLAGDENEPGSTYFYGTNADGEKGWHLLGDSFSTTTLAKTVDPVTGVVSYDLAELPDTGIGAALVKLTRDVYGRVEGTEAATTDDLAEGSANLYFTADRVRATVLTGLSLASSAVIAATDTVLSAFGKLQAQITALASSLSGYVPTTRTISTTAPLTGGGDLSANRTLEISAASGSAAGSMSSANFTKLAGIASGATVGADWNTNLSNIPTNITGWAGIAPGAKLDTSAVSAYMLTLLDDATDSLARDTLQAMPLKLVVAGRNADFTYAASDANTATGKTTGTPRTYTVDASILTVGAYYYAANYSSVGDVIVAAAVGTTMRLTGTATTGNRTVGPFGLGRIWVRSATEVWVDGPGVT